MARITSTGTTLRTLVARGNKLSKTVQDPAIRRKNPVPTGVPRASPFNFIVYKPSTIKGAELQKLHESLGSVVISPVKIDNLQVVYASLPPYGIVAKAIKFFVSRGLIFPVVEAPRASTDHEIQKRHEVVREDAAAPSIADFSTRSEMIQFYARELAEGNKRAARDLALTNVRPNSKKNGGRSK